MKNASAVQLVALPTPPASAVAGSLYYSNGGTLKWFNGSAWRTATADEDAGTVTGPKTFARATVGQGAGTAGILELARTQVATSGVTSQDSSVLRLTSNRWNGTAAVDESVDVTLKRRSATASDMYVNVPEDVEVTGYLNGSADVRVAGRSVGRGLVASGYTKLTASTTVNATTTITDVMTLTVTLVAGRRYRLSFSGQVISSAANDRAIVYFREGTTQLKFQQSATLVSISTGYELTMFTILDNPTAGSHTYVVSINRLSGTGNINISAAATAPAEFTVEDMGPNT